MGRGLGLWELMANTLLLLRCSLMMIWSGEIRWTFHWDMGSLFCGSQFEARRVRCGVEVLQIHWFMELFVALGLFGLIYVSYMWARWSVKSIFPWLAPLPTYCNRKYKWPFIWVRNMYCVTSLCYLCGSQYPSLVCRSLRSLSERGNPLIASCFCPNWCCCCFIHMF